MRAMVGTSSKRGLHVASGIVLESCWLSKSMINHFLSTALKKVSAEILLKKEADAYKVLAKALMVLSEKDIATRLKEGSLIEVAL